MKFICKIIFAFVLTILLSQTSKVIGQTNAQTTKNVLSEAEKASGEAVKLFKQQKFDEAFPFAQKALELNLKEMGAQNLKTAQSYINFGYIQIGRTKKKEAITAFENALLAFDKNSNLSKAESLTLAQMLESLAHLKFDTGKQNGSEKYYQRALELRENLMVRSQPKHLTQCGLWEISMLRLVIMNKPLHSIAAFMKLASKNWAL